jgi:hypothetical protein
MPECSIWANKQRFSAKNRIFGAKMNNTRRAVMIFEQKKTPARGGR